MLRAVGGLDLCRQFGREFPLPLDRSQDRLLAVGQLPRLADGIGDPPDVDFVEAAGLIAAVARDERNGVALVEQLHRRLDAGRPKTEPLGNLPQIDERYGSHPTGVTDA